GFNLRRLTLDSDAAPESFYTMKSPLVISAITPDGRTVLFSPWGRTKSELMVVPIAGGESRALLQDAGDPRDAVLSPDGTWMAYALRGGGNVEVFVRTFPPGSNKV